MFRSKAALLAALGAICAIIVPSASAGTPPSMDCLHISKTVTVARQSHTARTERGTITSRQVVTKYRVNSFSCTITDATVVLLSTKNIKKESYRAKFLGGGPIYKEHQRFDIASCVPGTHRVERTLNQCAPTKGRNLYAKGLPGS
jgi:hypothetical protein